MSEADTPLLDPNSEDSKFEPDINHSVNEHNSQEEDSDAEDDNQGTSFTIF